MQFNFETALSNLNHDVSNRNLWAMDNSRIQLYEGEGVKPVYPEFWFAGGGGAARSIFSGVRSYVQRTTLYRAVGPAELASIKSTNAFINPIGIESKYFTTSAQSASSYAQKAVTAFKDPPYTIVETSIRTRLLKDPKLFSTVDGGIPAYVLPSRMLSPLRPKVLPYSTLP